MTDKSYILSKNKGLLLNRKNELQQGDTKFVAEDIKTIDKLIDIVDGLKGQDLTDVVLIGSEVSVITNFEGTDEVDTYHLGLDLDIESGTISVLSKLGTAVFGHKVGETVSYFTDKRDLSARIVNEELELTEVEEKVNSYVKSI